MNAPAIRSEHRTELVRTPPVRTPPARHLAVSALGLALFAGACEHAPTAPRDSAPAELVAVVGHVELQSLGEVFSVDVRVLDRDGRELTGVPLHWAVGSPGVVEAVGGPEFRSVTNGTTSLHVRVADSYPHLDPGDYPSGLPATSIPVTVQQRAVSLRVMHDDPAALSGDTVRLWYLGQERALSLWTVDARGNPVDAVAGGASWAVEDPRITTAEGTGRLTALAEGVTAVRASARGMTGSIPVEVTPSLVLGTCVSVGGHAGECADRQLTFVAAHLRE